MTDSFCLPDAIAVSAFIICSGLCACTEMLLMCVLYVSFGSKEMWEMCPEPLGALSLILQ